MPAWTRLDTVLLVVVTGVAAGLRFVGLGSPADLVFDEIFYAQNACLLVAGPDVCGVSEPLSNAHPPLGQWLVGAGIAVAGYDPFGWRVASAIAGSLSVALTYVLARLVIQGDSTRMAALGATVASSLLALDVLHLVQSRVAMLDVFLALFVIAAFIAVVLDLRQAQRPGRGGIGHWLFGRPWRLMAGVLIGCAVGVKWSGVYSAIGVVLLVVAWEVAGRRIDVSGVPRGWRSAFGAAFRAEGLRTLVLLGVVPVLVYVATYVGVADGSLIAVPWREGSWFYDVAHHQLAMARFHVGLEGQHPYESPSWSWFLLKRPVAFWFEESSTYQHILSIGSPLAWWPSLAVFGWLGVSWLRGNRSLGTSVILVGALSAYLPWLVLGFARSQIFLWYVLPALPFLYAAVGVALVRWRGWARGVLVVGLVAALAAFVFFWPIATASPLAPDDWRLRMWFTDCERPGAPTLVLPDDTINTGPPPDGWCWI
ncbi:MAG TPA: phospholipid carrier-dependent glycosyltransferase [Candidatus Limnocylindria bacterium]|nr:phospholipid carrier-dependent glycosyltransferase [Candidatus Limnocylindria bacterium]